MKKIGSRIFVIFILVSTDSFMAMAQEAPFDLEIYKNFIAANKDISPLDLHKLYPSDLFKKSVTPFAEQDVLYLNEVISAYDLTDDEMELIKNNGFAVTERLRLGSYFRQFHGCI